MHSFISSLYDDIFAPPSALFALFIYFTINGSVFQYASYNYTNESPPRNILRHGRI